VWYRCAEDLRRSLVDALPDKGAKLREKRQALADALAAAAADQDVAADELARLKLDGGAATQRDARPAPRLPASPPRRPVPEPLRSVAEDKGVDELPPAEAVATDRAQARVWQHAMRQGWLLPSEATSTTGGVDYYGEDGDTDYVSSETASDEE